ncbi:hypothetical protein NEOLI_001968 [Neolecta irregularis DAH-3]|uniref:Uncharacterized protein n=1 Tax=Neolecta irregularis (strain DAH-3) TaxID=1198029 RepID=A0A1U7LLE0_NEOID|nr:hypothetical protein NEOLI_001968 [Neolecta irregularis DAH-3]|eukprot:OLL23459.1 hypothetical protein NEOLI_001968 [Neolecta irregularis DAH-3]
MFSTLLIILGSVTALPMLAQQAHHQPDTLESSSMYDSYFDTTLDPPSTVPKVNPLGLYTNKDFFEEPSDSTQAIPIVITIQVGQY